MRIVVALCLLLAPLVLAGDYAKMWSELEEQVKQKLSEMDDAKKDDSPKNWEQHKGWGDHKFNGWGDKKKVQEVAKDDEDSAQKDEDLAESWGRKEHKGWGEHRSKGWGDEKQKDSNDEVKDSAKDDFKKWEEHRSKGWGEQRRRKSEDDEKKFNDYDNDEEDVKENVKEKYIEFKEYMRRKAQKAEEDKEAKAEIYRQMERVQMKKFLAEKLEQMTEEYQERRMKFVFQATGHFLGLCQGDSNARDILERLDNGHFAVPEQVIQMNNGTGFPFDMNDEFDQDFNSSFARIMNDPAAKEAKIRALVNMAPEERVKLVLRGYVQMMCSTAQHFTNFVEMVESNIIACKRGLIRCDNNIPISG